MTKKELSQLCHLKNEARELNNRIKMLENAATKSPQTLTGMPYPAGFSDKVGIYAAQISDLKKELEKKLYECYREFIRLNRYIENVDDSQMRTILALRYVKCLSWQKIAYEIGEHDEQYPRRKHNIFLRKN